MNAQAPVSVGGLHISSRQSPPSRRTCSEIMDITDPIVAQIRACRGDWEMVSHLLPLGFSAGCHAVSKKSQEAFTARTRHASGQIVTIRGTLPAPGVFQPSCNRVCVARAERARMVCRVRYESALARLLWASSGITVCDPIVVVGTVTICDGMVHMGGVVNLDNSDVCFRVCGCSWIATPFAAATR